MIHRETDRFFTGSGIQLVQTNLFHYRRVPSRGVLLTSQEFNKCGLSCDLCKVLWIVENRFTTETTLPKQDYGELARLVSTTWRFMFITGEKNLQTIWDELSAKFKDLQWLNITEDSIWNTTRDREMSRTLTRDELKS